MTKTTEELSKAGRAQKLATLATEALYDEKKKVAELKHDIERHIKICSGQLQEIEDLDSQAKDHSHKVSTLIKAKEKFRRLCEVKDQQLDEIKSQLSNRDKENPESSWEYGEFLKPNSEKCKAQSSVFDALKLTHSMLPSLLLSQRNGGLSIEDWRALSNAGHTIKRDAQKVVAVLEQEALASLNKSKEGEEE